MHKLVKRFLIIIASASAIGLMTINAQPAQAKVTQVKRTAYHANQGNIYTSTALNQVRAKAKTYQNTTLYVTKHATLKQNGKKKVFYYIDSKKVQGWLWRGYLKAGKATPSVAAMNPAMAKQFLAQTNKYRAAKGMKPVILDPARMALLKTYKKWFSTATKYGDVNDDSFNVEAGKVGLPTDGMSQEFSQIKSKYDLKNSKRMGQYAIDTFMIIGNNQPDYKSSGVLQSDVTKIGVVWFEMNGKVFTLLIHNDLYEQL
ncbi:hypothetical protein [Lactiplantibacillus daowaiensis]|uniref:D-alanyl-D-alanine carboxypeptidase n=1 Tax=Lactiplantibacillus daowaiensis TaxID=2559918 RepID=A0ABW1RXK7_9LACO|nr:hypothetical protein [Lactiplantibacillus daowaiensis]